MDRGTLLSCFVLAMRGCEPRLRSSGEPGRRIGGWWLPCWLLIVGYLGAACSRESGPQGPPNILLVSLDTLRADRLGLYGYHLPTSPTLDELGAQSVVFETAIAQSSHTHDSHMSLFQSRYPTGTGSDHPWLPEILAGHGYDTAAFTGGGMLGAAFGFNRGFDVYQEDDGGFDETILAFNDWLQERADGTTPFFSFLHTYDIHVPYDPDYEYRDLFASGYSGPIVAAETYKLQRQYLQLQAPDATFESIEWNEADKEYFARLYDAGIRQTDTRLGDLIRLLDNHPFWNWDRDLLVIISDHGEEFWDHGSMGHGFTLYQEVLRVPLVIRLPGASKGGTRVASTVELLDLAPTLLALAGIESPGSFGGESMVDLWELGERNKRRTAAALTIGGLRTIIYGPWKLIISQEQQVEMLFNLEEDPVERFPMQDRRPDLVIKLKEALTATLGGQAITRDTIVDESQIDDPELRQRLEALGYLGDSN